MIQRTFRWLLLTLAVIGLTLDLASKYGVFRALYKKEFKLTDRSLNTLTVSGIPYTVIEKIKPLENQEFDGKEAFVQALSGRLNAQELPEYEDTLLHYALRNDPAVGNYELIPGAFKLHVDYLPESEPKCDCVLVKLNGPVPPRVNHGALFGLGGEHKRLANGFFAAISFLAAVAILFWGSRASTARDPLLCVALGLILGGTIGNLFDRIVFGGVRDFLYFYLIEWPVFNIADCCLVCGAGCLLYHAIFMQAKTEAVQNTI